MAYHKASARKKKTRMAFSTHKLRGFMSHRDDLGGVGIYRVLVGYLCIVFLIGGGSRSDVQSLLVLRPLAILTCGFALLTLRREHLRRYWFLFCMMGAVILLTAIHLIPLPPGVWQAFPGRESIIKIDDAVGIRDIWRPITMTPVAGRNALFSLFVPLAALLLVVQLEPGRIAKLSTPILALGALSGILGIFQVAGDPNGPLYLYRVTNNGSAVGLFSNRNHQAVMLSLLFPVMAFFASQPMKAENAIKIRLAIAIGTSIVLIPLILVTGSRLGIFTGAVGLVSGWFIYRRPEATGVRQRTERKNYTVPILCAVGLMVLVLITVLASRAEAVSRLLETNFWEEERAKAWALTAKIAWETMPIGSGSGSFVPLFQKVEPMDFLSPVYFNHAHNDWLEVWMTFGVPGLILLVVSLLSFFARLPSIISTVNRFSPDYLLARAGAAVVFLFGLASFADYPLRTPSLGCLFIIACCWMSHPDKKMLSSGNIVRN